jgi:DNA helicase-2/ATP-dependent DNA helicase PcrA
MLTLAEEQQRAVQHGGGPLLLLGVAGTGKTEALARRLARLAGEEVDADRVLLIAATPATARRLQSRAETLLRAPYEELWIDTWPAICERLLRAHSTAAGLNPFFDVLGPAERLAMMLDHLDELPLRNHEIRGNPAGLLARLLAQIDELKAGSDPPEPDLAEFCAAHDRIVAESGNLDEGDVFLTLGKLLHERPDIRTEIATRFAYVMVDEYEDTTPAQRTILVKLAEENPNHLYARDASAELTADVPSITLDQQFRRPALRRWRCSNERAQAQAVAREVEHLLGEGTAPGAICVLIDDPAANAGPVSAAMEERGVPFHLAGPAALFQRPEVRDAIAWLRVLAAPDDSPAAARALTRPPIELRAADLARLTTIARRRKVDMVSACEAALESPQIPPEGRERIQAFLKLYGEASAALEERRADVFVRRLIERVGLRRQRLFAAEPEVAERLLGLSRLAELASAWARREAHGTTRDFVRYLSAVAEAGVEPAGGEEPPSPGAVLGLSRRAAKGTEFDHVFLLGQGTEGAQARSSLVLSRIEKDGAAAEDSDEERQEEELFGPAEGLHATYRKLREEVLEASWRAGRELSEPRLDTVIDVNRAIARHLELLKLAALAQRPGEEATAEAIAAVNGLLRQVATPEQQTELDASPLDAYLLDSERERDGRRMLIAARHEPSLEAFLPRRGDGALSLSASDLDLYLTCPLKYKFRRVFGIPEEPTINQRFGILIHSVLERFHKDAGEGETTSGGLAELMDLFESGWRRSGFGSSDDELQFRDRAREAMRLYWEREQESEGVPVWLERKFDIRIGEHQVRGRVDRVDRLPDGGYELIDYKTGRPKTPAQLREDVQLSLYAVGARESWQLDAASQAYYYVLDDEKVPVERSGDDRDWITDTVFTVADGILGQGFEPTPSWAACSMCDYRIACPAAER